MMSIISYQGYTAKIEYSYDDRCFVGHIQNLKNNVVGFHAADQVGIQIAFQEAVDDYRAATEHTDKSV